MLAHFSTPRRPPRTLRTPKHLCELCVLGGEKGHQHQRRTPPDSYAGVYPMVAVTLDEIKRQREFNYRRTPERRVRTVEEARAFVEEVGFCHFWPIKKQPGGRLAVLAHQQVVVIGHQAIGDDGNPQGPAVLLDAPQDKELVLQFVEDAQSAGAAVVDVVIHARLPGEDAPASVGHGELLLSGQVTVTFKVTVTCIRPTATARIPAYRRWPAPPGPESSPGRCAPRQWALRPCTYTANGRWGTSHF